jgi:hypothetical protein
MVPKFSLGRLCDPADTDQLAETLGPALLEAQSYKRSAAADRLVEFHQSENFIRQWRQGLSQLMGKSEDGPLRDWQWVLGGENDKPLRLETGKFDPSHFRS